ncbi:uncharacterized protein LOC135388278 isoform X2 [Ornithodoros turicata]|uniref:uncharacterized protein LOC135388278 isoform X2 n=1 Tax=Ornithodoros turicata TaxID=34597 RepID=UPI0031388934
MPGTQCCVWLCSSNHMRTREESNDVSYHNVPKCKKRRLEWSRSLGMDLQLGHRVCSKHFTIGSYEEFLPGSQRRRLKKSALPKMETEAPSGNAEVSEGASSANGSLTMPELFVSALSAMEDVGSIETLHSGHCMAADDNLVQPVPVDSVTPADHAYAQSHPKKTKSSYAQVSLRAESCSIGVQTNPMDILCTKCGGGSSHSTEHLSMPSPVTVSTPKFRRVCGAEEEQNDTISTVQDDRHDDTYSPSLNDSFAEGAGETKTSVCDEQKFIVFESCLRQLFQRCRQCDTSCRIKLTVRGTLVDVSAECLLGHITTWRSQPHINGFAAGNILLAGAILFNGAAPTKVWNTESQNTLAQLGDVNVLGDGRCDSPGHSAKYLTYTFMDAATSKVLHFVQVQVGEAPEVKSSSQMEKYGFIRALEGLKDAEVSIASVITDRHPAIRKYMREKEPDMQHTVDTWHVVKGLQKKLEAACRSQGCSDLKPWVTSICYHLYWSNAVSQGNSELRLSIWRSASRHVLNMHADHDGPYSRCLHDNIRGNKWLRADSAAYRKLLKIIMDPRLLRDIGQLSSVGQTSSLESYHAVIVKFAPKSTAYTPNVMKARTQLAALHFNENAGREHARRSDGQFMFRRKLQKAKKGAEVVAPVKTKATHEYVKKLLEEATQACEERSFRSLLRTSLSPEPPTMTSAYAREPKDILIARRMLRFHDTTVVQ